MTGFRQYLAILRWELRYYLRRISTWVYFTIFLALSFFFMLAAGGAWDEVSIALGSGGKVLANAPFALASLMPVISLLGVSVTAALAGNSLYRDYEAKSDPLFYTTPVGKGAFLGGRFTGVVIVNAIVLLGLAVGAYVATITPWVHADKIAPFNLMAYVTPYLTHILPNLLLTAAIFFALVSFTRQMLPNYVGGALLLVGYLLAGSAFSSVENKHLAGLIDPFGMRAMSATTQYWSIAEKNTRIVPFAGVLVTNRLIWLSVAAVIFAVAFIRFRFAHQAGESTRRATETPPETAEIIAPVRLAALPAVERRFGRDARWVQFRSVFARSFWRVVRSRYFGAIVGGGLLYLIVAARATGALFGTKTYPVTYQMTEVLGGTFSLFILVVIAFYAGELVWAERDVKINQIYDATPIPSSLVLVAKFLALAGIVASLLIIAMFAGMVTQMVRGYFRFEVPVYLEALLGVQFVDFVLIAVLAMAIHVVTNHKYLSHLLVILVYIGLGLLGTLGFEHNLYQYGSGPGMTYSDMNRWGPFLVPFVWWKLYWAAFATLLLVLCDLYWVRGEETQFAARTRLARQRFSGAVRATAAGAGLAFVGLGGFLFYNTNILNDYRSSKDDRHDRAVYEKQYKRLASLPQPRIAGVTLTIELYPRQQNAVMHGQYLLRNKTGVPIDSVLLAITEDLDIRSVAFDRPSKQVLADKRRDFYIHQLAQPLAPGDSMVMTFDLAHITRGFPNQIRNLFIVENGTFFENAFFMPDIGYNAGAEIADDDARKKEGLPPKARMRPPTDPATWTRSYISRDADWVTYDATVSTDPDQLAITSGYLQREWTEKGRRYFHYTMDAPVINLWAFQSARYTTRKDTWQSVNVEIDYHPAHAYNVERMVTAIKKSLDYYTTNFGPYQFHQVRIVEFPRYQRFAQSLPNTIPYSEAIGFIARVEKAEDIDYPFYVTAHEVAHQWWAHQVVGADAQGSTMLSETMAQYSALMVMEKEFGPANMRRFLEYELDSYLLGRSTERKKEMPLVLGENQPYIHYNKGSLVMYAMRDYIGEDRLNAAIRGFLGATRFKGPPYPTSLQLVDSLRAATPDSLKYLIADLFENITLYELKADSVLVKDAPGRKYQVDLFVHAKKLRADSVGTETEQPMNDWIDIGLFARADKPDPKVDPKVGVPLYLEKHRIGAGAQHISVIVDRKPYRAGIDPLHKLIDRQTTDNTTGVRDRTAFEKSPAVRVTAPKP